MKNRTTIYHGMLPDLKSYLIQSGWKLEPPVGDYEVLRPVVQDTLDRFSFTIERPVAAGTV